MMKADTQSPSEVVLSPVTVLELSMTARLYEIQWALDVIDKSATAHGASGKYKWQFIPVPELIVAVYPHFQRHNMMFHWKFTPGSVCYTLECLDTGEQRCSTFTLPTESFQELGKHTTYYTRLAILGLIGLVGDVDLGGEERATFNQPAPRQVRARDLAAEVEDDEEGDYEEEEARPLPRRGGATPRRTIRRGQQ